MAKQIATFDFTKPSNLTTSERKSYPWGEWLDGNIWQLTWSEDFDTHPLMMERIIRTRATAKGAKVQMRHTGLNGNVPAATAVGLGKQFGIITIRRTDITAPKARKATTATKVPTKKVAVKAVATKKVAPAKKAPAKKVASKPAVSKAVRSVGPSKKAASKKAPARK